VQEADILLVESTYGNRNNPPNHPDRELEEIVNETFDRGGIVLVPAFAVGRTQMLLYYLKQLILAKRIPDCPVYIDSPMAVSATHLYKKYLLENENVQADEDLFDFPNFRYCASYEASSELQGVQQRAIIISASGMATGGRVVQHLYHRLPNPRNTILFAGYQAAGTRGRDLTEGRTEVKMFGELVPVKAKVQLLEGLSAHADRTELLQWLDQFKKAPKQTFVVHGEPDSAQALAQAIGEKNWNVSIPEYLESALLFRNI
jgi:metallo-beta-lactamase family protein